MALAVDLHAHSSYAGGAGQLNLRNLAGTMRRKGIRVCGTGDCQFPAWQTEYSDQLEETPDGLFRYPNTESMFLLQTEVIVTTALPGYTHRISAHHVILFPDLGAVQKFTLWMQVRGHKNTIARPFIVCRDSTEVEDSLFEIQALDPLVEIIPAHVLTPDGILGSKNDLTSMREFYGNFTEHIHAVETGLSADPQMLKDIPDLRSLAFVSNSDFHSSALNKVGREYTVLDTDYCTYEAIISAIRSKRIKLTVEFPSREGRYYLTGHRADRHADGAAVCFPQKPPEDFICPNCGRRMLPGVRDRALQLSSDRSADCPQKYQYLIPLIEVIAAALNQKSVSGRKAGEYYEICVAEARTEIRLWSNPEEKLHELLDNKLPREIIQSIAAVQRGAFSFDPAGFDGSYGALKINRGT